LQVIPNGCRKIVTFNTSDLLNAKLADYVNGATIIKVFKNDIKQFINKKII
jgi:hypothetical protein